MYDTSLVRPKKMKILSHRIDTFARSHRKAQSRLVQQVDVALAQLSNQKAAEMIDDRLLAPETLVFSTKE